MQNTQYVHTPHTHTCSRVLTHAHTHAYRNSGSNTKCPSGTTSTCEIQTIDASDTASDQYGSTVGAAVVWNTADFPAGITDPGPTYVLFFYPIGKRAALCCVSIHCCAFPPTPHPLVSSILCAPLRLFNLCFNALIPQRLAHLFEMILDTTQPWEPAHAELEARCTRGCSLCATRRRRLQWPK